MRSTSGCWFTKWVDGDLRGHCLQLRQFWRRWYRPDRAMRHPSRYGGSLCYRSAISGRYEPVPLVHTDVSLDVRGLVAAATVTQQYVNNSTAPIEAVYIFPLPHDAAAYDWKYGLAIGHSKRDQRAGRSETRL